MIFDNDKVLSCKHTIFIVALEARTSRMVVKSDYYSTNLDYFLSTIFLK